MTAKPPEEVGPQKKPPAQVVRPEPPKVSCGEIAGKVPVEFGVGEHMGQSMVCFRMTALQNLHGRPGATLEKLVRHFKSINPANNLLIPMQKNEAGNAERESGMQAMSNHALYKLFVGAGCEIDLMAVGPDARSLANVVAFVFQDGNTGFSRKSADYLTMLKEGGIPQVFSTGMKPASVQEMPPDMDFRRLVDGDIVLEGVSVGTGTAVCGKAVVKEEFDYTQRLKLVGKDELNREVLRLESLGKVMGAGRVHSAGLVERVLGYHKTSTTKPSVVQEIREGEATLISGFVNDAIAIMSKPVDQQELARRNLKLPAGSGPFPNAELAIELSVNLAEYPMEAREMVEELKRLMMYRLVGGLNIKDSMAYILGQLVFSTGERPSFRRAGIFLLDEEAGRKVLETRYEWKDRGFVELEYGAKIPLDKEGDGTAHIAREALKNDSKIPLAFFVDNVQSDPRTNKGYSEYNSCAWTSIHGPDGKLLGVLWADARDEHSITDDMMRSLADVSREAGGIISMTQKISGGKRHHQGDISVFERPPTGDHVLSLMSAGWSGFASNLGGRASHGVIIAGGNRFTGVVGVGVRLHSIPDGSTLLIVDPADSRLGYVVCSPTKATLDFFGLTEIGQQVSIEPESVDIHDAVTKDGFRVHLMGSLQGTGSEQLERYVKYGAEGVGLFRTEMAMINDPPSFTLVSPDSPRLLEDYFYDRYRNLVGTLSRDARAYRDAPIIFRLIDVAPNKYPQIFRNSFGDFDMLQSTGLRFLLEHKQKVLAPQLNAVSRVADDVEREGPKIMVMTSNVQSLKDWVEFRDFMRSVRGERFSRPVGCVAQLETPGVINEIPHLLKYVDGIAFGTNDLTVRTLGLPGRVGVKHDEFNPQVLRTLKTGVDSVLSAKNTPCMICGCLAESPEGVAILIGMGVEHISVPPRYIPEMRRVIPGVTQADCKAMLDEILTSTSESLSTPKGVHEFVRRRIRHS